MKIKKLILLLGAIILLTLIFVSIIFAYYDLQAKDENYVNGEEIYIINIRSKKIHQKDCGTAKGIYEKNRKIYSGDIDDLIDEGYTLCGNCFRGSN